MLNVFQPLENKEECIGIYHDGRLLFNEDISYEELNATWEYSTSLPRKNFKYAKLFCEGKSLNDVCPQDLSDKWKSSKGRLKAFFNSFKHAKISLNEHCFYDLVPENFLYEYFDLQNRISEYVFENYEQPENYDFLKSEMILAKQIEKRKLNYDISNLDEEDPEQNKIINKVKKSRGHIRYDIFGTRTGRFTTKKNSFPILNINSDLRNILKPNNDMFVELDYNSADLRVFLGLLGKEQPQEDIHNWNYKNIMDNSSKTRSDLKKEIFSWLYNPQKNNKKFEDVYDRDQLVDKFFDGKYVTNIFNRKMRTDSYRALSYIIQSTANDIMLKSVFEIDELIADMDSEVAFVVHDSIMLDFSKNDLDILPECAKIMSQTQLGRFVLNTKAGYNWGKMKEVNFAY